MQFRSVLETKMLFEACGKTLRRPWGLQNPSLGIYIPSFHGDLAYESFRHRFMFHWQIFVITKSAGLDRSSIFARMNGLKHLRC